MKTAIVIALALLTGCAEMSTKEKLWTGAAVGAIVVGAIALQQNKSDESSPDKKQIPTTPNCSIPGSCN